ncbi:hypothetical protein HF086_018267 [Spodoptera exigua]|uniref:Ion transport domain-containing protein n=1 Tax=Spodoptera exigua TaxID=7107 RepID=A0A922MYJ0_SPOEX|nr:hypothetical protein HF086_018267 [Spodoptera exigua]
MCRADTRTGTDGAGDSGTLDMGSRSSLHTGLNMSEDEHWEMNYHEAAIYLELPVWAHGTIELLALTVIGVELHLKLKWIGWGTILKHKRTMIKGITLLIMVLEAVVVLCRQSSHFRVTRALRPIFLVDTRHCGGVRRFIRQILQSLPPIIDMLGLLMFFVATYSLLGYYLFSEHVDNGHFQTISDSFVSMFVLLTTANFPDVMMPSYAKSKWYAVFFILYIITVLYVLMNLVSLDQYNHFQLFILLYSRLLSIPISPSESSSYQQLASFCTPLLNLVSVDAYRPFDEKNIKLHVGGLDVYLMFKQLNQSSSGGLSRSEFANLYEVFALRWAGQQSRAPWYSQSPLEPLGRAAAAAVRWPYFEYLIYALIIGNGMAMVLRVCEAAGDLQDSARLLCASWDTWLFLTLFLLEAALRMMASGLAVYLESGWNVFDLSVTLLALMGAVLLSIAPKLFIVVIFRPLSWMCDAGHVLLLRHHRHGTLRRLRSKKLLCVFYLFTMVVLTIVVASVLEAFRFRIQYKRSTTKRDEEKLLHEEVHTSWEEAQRLGASGDLADELRPNLPPGVEVTFIGSRPRTKEVLQRRMYQTDIQKWLAEEDENEGVPPSTTITSSEDPLAPPLIHQPDSENNHQMRTGYQL